MIFSHQYRRGAKYILSKYASRFAVRRQQYTDKSSASLFLMPALIAAQVTPLIFNDVLAIVKIKSLIITGILLT